MLDWISRSGLFSFAGRQSRRSFWRWYLRFNLAMVAVWVLGIFAVMAVGPFGAPVFLISLPLAIAYIAMWVRRAHDRNHGIVWLIFFTVGPYLALALSEALSVLELVPAWISLITGAVLMLAALVLNIWATIDLMFRRGGAGPNRFGAPA